MLRKALSLLLFIYINPIENEKLNWQKVVYIPILTEAFLFYLFIFYSCVSASIQQKHSTGLEHFTNSQTQYLRVFFYYFYWSRSIRAYCCRYAFVITFELFVRLLSIHCVGLLLIQNVVPRFGINAFIFIVF